MSEQPSFSYFKLKINGSDVPDDMLNQVYEIVAENSMQLPDMFTIRLYDDELVWVDDAAKVKPGATVQIEFSTPDGQSTVSVISGEITAIEPVFTEDWTVRVNIHGYAKSHRLSRGAKTKAFKNVKISDVVQQVASGGGVSASVDATTQVYEQINQDGQSDLAFIYELAARVGYQVYMDGDTLYFKKPDNTRGEITLAWGTDLISFRPRLTVAGQVNEVKVKGWDIEKKEAITGQKTSSATAPAISIAGSGGGAVAQSALSAAADTVIRRPVVTQAEADAVAQAVLDARNDKFVEAEGEAAGNPNLKAGTKVNLTGLGTRFSGKYVLTSVTHVFNADGEYVTRFKVEGSRPTLIADLVGRGSSNGNGSRNPSIWPGVVPAIVTNIKDAEKDLYRVKLKFPWIDDTLESNWARIAALGAGAQRGIYWLPEVNDEVLVAFEHGDFNRPYVIGGLWNGKDKPPEAIGAGEKDGKSNTRTIKTRAGHLIRFTDDDAKPTIEIIDSEQATTITLNAKEKTLDITCKGKITINADDDITMKSKKGITIEATNDLILKGKNINATAVQAANIKGNQAVNIEGAQVSGKANAALSLQGQASAELKSSGMLTIQGTLVKIN
ncbi:MAG: VgrG-related protein [Anaerolineae bacterium]|nr:VgrG-related protein [Anaerolineae bacterium]